MRILWTDEALEDLAEIVSYYYAKASSFTAESVQRRIIEHVEQISRASYASMRSMMR